MPRGGNEPVGDDIIYKIRTHRAGIAQIVHLDGSGPQGYDFSASRFRVPFQVHKDVNLVLVNSPGSINERTRSDVHKPATGTNYTLTHIPAIIRSVRIGHHLKAGLVMQLKQLGD